MNLSYPEYGMVISNTKVIMLESQVRVSSLQSHPNCCCRSVPLGVLLLCPCASARPCSRSHHEGGSVASSLAMSDHVQQQQPPPPQPDGTTSLSSHRSTPAHTPPSSASSPFKKGMQQVELELRLLEAFAIYRPSMLVGMHRHFILFGLMDHLERRLNQRFSPDEVLQLLDRFFNLELLKPDDEELELVTHEEDFSLPPSIFEDAKKKTSA